jgi:hypothetical protein
LTLRGNFCRIPEPRNAIGNPFCTIKHRIVEEGADILKRSFGDNHERLRRVKQTFDPENLFRHNLTFVGSA